MGYNLLCKGKKESCSFTIRDPRDYGSMAIKGGQFKIYFVFVFNYSGLDVVTVDAMIGPYSKAGFFLLSPVWTKGDSNLMFWSACQDSLTLLYKTVMTLSLLALEPVYVKLRALASCRGSQKTRAESGLKRKKRKIPGSHSLSHKLFHNVKPSLILSALSSLQTEDINAVTMR